MPRAPNPFGTRDPFILRLYGLGFCGTPPRKSDVQRRQVTMFEAAEVPHLRSPETRDDQKPEGMVSVLSQDPGVLAINPYF